MLTIPSLIILSYTSLTVMLSVTLPAVWFTTVTLVAVGILPTVNVNVWLVIPVSVHVAFTGNTPAVVVLYCTSWNPLVLL